MGKSIEEKVEEYYKKVLDDLNLKYYGKTQANSMNEGIAKALASAPSKSGGNGNNFPDIMLMLYLEETNRHIPVVIEAKGTKNKLEKLDNNGMITQIVPWGSDSKDGAKNPHKKGDPNPTAIVSFAVNGAYHYAKSILESEECSFEEIIFIGVNGNELDNLNRVKNPEQKAYYLSKENKMQPKHIVELDKSWDLFKQENLEKFFSILDKITLSEGELQELTNKTENDLEKSVKKIHQEIYDNESLKSTLSTNEKLFLFSGLIMAGLQTKGVSRLEPKDLKGNDSNSDNDSITIMGRINTFLEKRKADSHKTEMIETLLKPVLTKKVLWKPNNGESLIRRIYTDVYKEIIPLLESELQLDFTGKILNSLND